MRRFAIIGHRAMASGKLPINDLAGAAGRMDVLVRALMASLMTSHGLRKDSEIILHLWGGPGPRRRLKFVGSEVSGIHAEERSVAGQIAKVIREPVPPIGSWVRRSPGIYDSGGSIEETINEWQSTEVVVLDAEGPRLWTDEAFIPIESTPHSLSVENDNSTHVEGIDIGFIIGDDKPLNRDILTNNKPRSLGSQWLQGHMAIAICHFVLDEGIALNL